MLHLGDVRLLSGHDIPPVDVITGGSPCQDLSVAGKRIGLSGERSGLFLEQVRIVREMREASGKPRYMVWENVPGALSSNKGQDFWRVLQEVAWIADEDAVIPRPPKGKWTPSGCILADGWSVAWRVHDAQFWGVPQRRRRIALVADFGGGDAPEILFERKGVPGGTREGEEAGEGASQGAEGSIGEPICFEPRSQDGYARIYGGGVTPTLNTAQGGQRQPCVLVSSDKAHALRAKANLMFREDSETYIVEKSFVRRLTPLECERLQGYPDGWTDIGDYENQKGQKRKTSDTARYKALGNSIALPFWQWMAGRMENCKTMGSLFDGIGGFPLAFSRAGTCPVWASEIEEFPIAVTRARFVDDMRCMI